MKLEIVKKEPPGKRRPFPLLFIHGMFHGAWCWEENFFPFFTNQGFVCYALSLRGHGKSEGKEKVWRTSINDYLEDIHFVVTQIMNETGCSPVLIGHSMGGSLVQLYLSKHNATGCALLASGPPWGWLPLTINVIRRNPLNFLMINLRLSMYVFIKTPKQFREVFFGVISEEKLMAYHKLTCEDSYLAFIQLIAWKLPKISKIKAPVLVLGGEMDRIFSVASTQGTARAYGTDPIIFEGIGHELMVEDRWKDVAECMLNWFNQNGW